ncbi:hypothetical protein J2S55_005890 [Streptosporangium brasiliense]|uniref:Uncharacterized protein n=1 Tax=Streptosporangium brasiliense TaxID=47480 RepID=A0ABT9RBI5_9ACTN|nr:hypothetical protein [Streptosporangium brasiliense]
MTRATPNSDSSRTSEIKLFGGYSPASMRSLMTA